MNEIRIGAGTHKMGEPSRDTVPGNPLATRVLNLPRPEPHIFRRERYRDVLLGTTSTAPGPAVQIVSLLVDIQNAGLDRSPNPVIARYSSSAMPGPARWNGALVAAIADLGAAVGLDVQVQIGKNVYGGNGEADLDRLHEALEGVELPENLRRRMEQHSNPAPALTTAQPSEGTAVFDATERLSSDSSRPDFILRITTDRDNSPTPTEPLINTVSIDFSRNVPQEDPDIAKVGALMKLADIIGNLPIVPGTAMTRELGLGPYGDDNNFKKTSP